MSNRIRTAGRIGILAVAAVYAMFGTCFAGNADYAALPPFLTADVKPNVLLVMDYSGSMQAQAHYPAPPSDEPSGYSSTSNVLDYSMTEGISVPYNEPGFDKRPPYYGYFESNAYYFYNSTEEYWEVDYREHDREYTSSAANGDSISGDVLNFLVTSRMDAALKSLIGGKGSCPEGEDHCVLESQGARRELGVTDLNLSAVIEPENWRWGNYEDKDIEITIGDNGGSSAIGTFTRRKARVKIDAERRRGIVQENFDNVRFAFIPYSCPENDRAHNGTIRYGVHDNDMDALVQEIESVAPYLYTHTGEAMREAYAYLRQDGSLSGRNSDYNRPGTTVDPYYEENTDGELHPAWCRDSFVLLISDGEWNGDVDPAEWALEMHTTDLRPDMRDDQRADVFTVFAFTNEQGGLNSMQATAACGNFDSDEQCNESDGWPFGIDLSGSRDSRDISFPIDNCRPGQSYDVCCRQWDKTGDGIPDAFFDVRGGEDMDEALGQIFRTMRQTYSSGSAVTSLSESAPDAGSAMVQAGFFPEMDFDGNRRATWTGNLFATWYLNAHLADEDGVSRLVQNIREDTNENYVLDVEEDRIIEFGLNDRDALEIRAWESDQYGGKTGGDPQTYSDIGDIATLIDCGKKLEERTPDSRKIFGADETDDKEAFTAGNAGLFQGNFGNDTAQYPDCLISGGLPDYENLIRWVRGEAVDGCRSRVTDDRDPASINHTNVWKMGDIIHSTPAVVNYGDFRMIYTGSNSGMIHAFRLGRLQNRRNSMHPAALQNSRTDEGHDEIGTEEWAFVPKDAMPYLRYIADPLYDHIYTVDMEPFVIDTGERTILIGGMRLGGACGNGDINPPGDTTPTGLSSYFALDVTNPMDPEYLWRFTDENLGFAYSGPAYVRRENPGGGYRHYVLFASGPTGHDGTSTQRLSIFVLDLYDGNLVQTFDHNTPGTNKLTINDAFGGRLHNSGLDRNKDGQTDFVFLGYTDDADQDPKDFWKMGGGVIKLFTGDAAPRNWAVETILQSDNNPVTGSVLAMDCFSGINGHPYLYFGTGRYFISDDRTHRDSGNDRNYLYGVPFTCDSDNRCTGGGVNLNHVNNNSQLTCSNVADAENYPTQGAWKIPLHSNRGEFLSERFFLDPGVTDHDMVFFTTSSPTDVICECGGESRAWAVNCATGRGIGVDVCENEEEQGLYMVDPDSRFQLNVQLSGGNIAQLDETDFIGGERGNGSSSGDYPGAGDGNDSGDDPDDGDDDDGSKEIGPGIGAGGDPSFGGIGDRTYWKQW